MQANPLSSMIPTLISSGLTIALCVLGIIFALVQREKSPKAATFVMISLVVLLLLMIVRPIGFNMLRQIDGGAKFTISSIWSFICNLVDMACTAGLIFAAFCDRTAPLGTPDPFALQVGGAPPSTNPYVALRLLPPLGGSMKPPPNAAFRSA
jgi:hypothetical protein